MSMSDPVADLLTRVRNAQLARKSSVRAPASKLKKAVADVLLDEGYISDLRVLTVDGKPVIELDLKYYSGFAVIESIIRVSKPGLRIYKSCTKLPVVMNGMGVAIVSTSKGVMTGRTAKSFGVGGEVLCYVT